MSANHPPFRVRSFATLLLVLSFLLAGVSGVVMFLRPEGSLARWVGWTALGLDKKQWEALHITFVAAFLVMSSVHIWYNWKPLVAYVKRRVSALQPSARWQVPVRELMAALVVTASIWCGTLVEWQPLSGLIALRTAMKDGAFLAMTPPPVPEAEKLRVADVCRLMELPEKQAVENARARGVLITSTSVTLGAIAAAHDLSPEEVYEALQGEHGARRARP